MLALWIHKSGEAYGLVHRKNYFFAVFGEIEMLEMFAVFSVQHSERKSRNFSK